MDKVKFGSYKTATKESDDRAPKGYRESVERARREGEKIKARLRAKGKTPVAKTGRGFFGFKNKGGNEK